MRRAAQWVRWAKCAVWRVRALRARFFLAEAARAGARFRAWRKGTRRGVAGLPSPGHERVVIAERIGAALSVANDTIEKCLKHFRYL